MQPESLNTFKKSSNDKITNCESEFSATKKDSRKKFKSKIPVSTKLLSVKKFDSVSHSFIIEAPEQFRQCFQNFVNDNEPFFVLEKKLTDDVNKGSSLISPLNNYDNENLIRNENGSKQDDDCEKKNRELWVSSLIFNGDSSRCSTEFHLCENEKIMAENNTGEKLGNFVQLNENVDSGIEIQNDVAAKMLRECSEGDEGGGDQMLEDLQRPFDKGFHETSSPTDGQSESNSGIFEVHDNESHEIQNEKSIENLENDTIKENEDDRAKGGVGNADGVDVAVDVDIDIDDFGAFFDSSKDVSHDVDVEIHVHDDNSIESYEKEKHASSYQFSAVKLSNLHQILPQKNFDSEENISEIEFQSLQITDNSDINENEISLIFKNSQNSEFIQNDGLQISTRQIDKEQKQNYVPSCQKCSNPIFVKNITIMGQENNQAKKVLKSSLKKSNKSKDSRNNPLSIGLSKKKKTHRVVFNESKNEFFEADYIILIREDCDYPENDDYEFEEDDNNNDIDDCECTCERNLSDKTLKLKQQQNVQLKCCNEPNCCYCYDLDESDFKDNIYCDKSGNGRNEMVTLSPPDGYKDMDLGEKQILALKKLLNMKRQEQEKQKYQMQASPGSLCKDCLEQHENDMVLTTSHLKDDNKNLKVSKIEQYPSHDIANQIVMETVTTTTVTERRIIRKEQAYYSANANQSPVNGILKGGKLWKQPSLDLAMVCENPSTVLPIHKSTMQSIKIDETLKDDDNSKRTVRFSSESLSSDDINFNSDQSKTNANEELIRPYKIGSQQSLTNSNHNNSRQNSAVRQLFPDTKPLLHNDSYDLNYMNYQKSHFSDESVRKVIERNTLRRSLIKYEPKSKKNVQMDNSLVEKIKQLTCDIESYDNETDSTPTQSSAYEDANQIEKVTDEMNKLPSSVTSTTYKKLTDLFTKKEKHLSETCTPQNVVSKINATSEARRQILSSLGPFTSCVTAQTSIESNEVYEVTNHNFDDQNGERYSNCSSLVTDYSLQDIDDVLKYHSEERNHSKPPDVLHGTNNAVESSDELAVFVQQDASRIERVKKKYQSEEKGSNHSNGDNAVHKKDHNNVDDDEDDELNDYGFNKRPSVRGVIRNVETTSTSQPASSNQSTMKQCQLTCCRNSSIQENQISQQMAYYYPYEISHPPIMSTTHANNVVFRNRPQSPPPLKVAKNYQQTMIFIPYNNLMMNEGNVIVPQNMQIIPNFYNHQYLGGQMISSTTQTSYLTRQQKNSFCYSSNIGNRDNYQNSKDFFESSQNTLRKCEKALPSIDGTNQDCIIQNQTTINSTLMTAELPKAPNSLHNASMNAISHHINNTNNNGCKSVFHSMNV